MHLPANHFVDRQTGLFSDDVPAGHFYQRQRCHDDLAGTAEVQQSEAAVQRFDIERVMPHEVTARVFKIFKHRVRLTQNPRLSDAANPLVRF